MSSNSPAVSIQGIAKTYRIAVAGGPRRLLRRRPKEAFPALRDINIDVERGEAVAIIGSNGAGKSTLLKILSRVVEPTAGRIEVYGRVGSLLEIGTGFHPELTGRENIFLNGAVLGLSRRDTLKHLDSITEFAGVDQFLETPVKRYSSGMYVRLAFAVAAHLDPDILLVDEVLAVGDAAFQRKCLGKMDEASRQEGRTIVFVSHNMAAVESFCRRGIVLESGRVVFDGAVSDAVAHYLSSALAESDAGGGVTDLTAAPRRKSTTPVFRRIGLRDDTGVSTSRIMMGGGLSIAVEVDGLRVPEQGVVVRVSTERDAGVISLASTFRPLEVHRQGQPDEVVLHLRSLPLVAGRYWIDLFVQEGGHLRTKKTVVDHIPRAASFEVLPRDVYGSGYEVRNDGPWSGVIFVDHGWEMSREGAVVATSGMVPANPSGTVADGSVHHRAEIDHP